MRELFFEKGLGVIGEGSMSVMRKDPTTEEWVVLATERARRPHEPAHDQHKAEPPAFVPSCPFCPGNEAKTPPETLVYRNHKDGSWQVRGFANRYPALREEGMSNTKLEEGFFMEMNGLGIHEVIVESPEHNKPLALMKDSGVKNILLAYQERYNILRGKPFVKHITVFENHGASAGTSLEHPHSQLIATPVVPRDVRLRQEIAARYHDDTGRNLYADLLDHELRLDKRIVMKTEGFVVFHPFASHEPFETWIMPKRPQACFGNAPAADLEEFAHVLRMSLAKLYHALNDPDYNLVIDTVLPGGENEDCYLWHLRIIPRLAEVAGFEIGSGININTTLPEETAQFMREFHGEEGEE
jgi:UDPglucose--hexose-1-phosphate uridylyltransferase